MNSLYRTIVASVSFLILTAPAFSQASHPPQVFSPPPMPAPQTPWVAASLKEMETVKVGMTRAQLLKVFTDEGGLSTRTDEVYVYHACPYFKVRVTFHPVGKDAGYFGNMNDKIVSISEPFLQWTISN